MIFVRLREGVTKHFPSRRSEWGLALILAGGGLVFLGPGSTFSLNPMYIGLSRIASEQTWGWFCLVVGAIRLVALIANGTFYESRYGRYSPHIRCVLSVVSAVGFWLQISIAVFWSVATNVTGGDVPWAIVIFPLFTAGDFVNAYFSIVDARSIDLQKAWANDGHPQ